MISTSNGKRNPHCQIDIFVNGCEKHRRKKSLMKKCCQISVKLFSLFQGCRNQQWKWSFMKFGTIFYETDIKICYVSIKFIKTNQ